MLEFLRQCGNDGAYWSKLVFVGPKGSKRGKIKIMRRSTKDDWKQFLQFGTIQTAANDIMTIQYNTIQNRKRQDGTCRYETKDNTEKEKGWKKKKEGRKKLRRHNQCGLNVIFRVNWNRRREKNVYTITTIISI